MKTMRIRQLLVSSVVMGCAVLAGAAAQASVMTATLTADNHYGLFVGNESGSDLQFIGRNEFGPAGSPGTYNWSLPETYSFNIDIGEYLYVVAWNVEREHSFIGEFTTSFGTVLTNATDWIVTLGGLNPTFYGGIVPVDVQAFIALANAFSTWQAPNFVADQGTSPWGSIAGISEDAKFIWKEVVLLPENLNYQIFRTAVAHTPLPAALPLFATGLLGLAWIRRRQRKRD